jgi:hypothetical protein
VNINSTTLILGWTGGTVPVSLDLTNNQAELKADDLGGNTTTVVAAPNAGSILVNDTSDNEGIFQVTTTTIQLETLNSGNGHNSDIGMTQSEIALAVTDGTHTYELAIEPQSVVIQNGASGGSLVVLPTSAALVNNNSVVALQVTSTDQIQAVYNSTYIINIAPTLTGSPNTQSGSRLAFIGVGRVTTSTNTVALAMTLGASGVVMYHVELKTLVKVVTAGAAASVGDGYIQTGYIEIKNVSGTLTTLDGMGNGYVIIQTTTSASLISSTVVCSPSGNTLTATFELIVASGTLAADVEIWADVWAC